MNIWGADDVNDGAGRWVYKAQRMSIFFSMREKSESEVRREALPWEARAAAKPST